MLSWGVSAEDRISKLLNAEKWRTPACHVFFTPAKVRDHIRIEEGIVARFKAERAFVRRGVRHICGEVEVIVVICEIRSGEALAHVRGLRGIGQISLLCEVGGNADAGQHLRQHPLPVCKSPSTLIVRCAMRLTCMTSLWVTTPSLPLLKVM